MFTCWVSVTQCYYKTETVLSFHRNWSVLMLAALISADSLKTEVWEQILLNNEDNEAKVCFLCYSGLALTLP